MRRTSAKPGMQGEALRERPCDFCHWSLPEVETATSYSQKVSWGRKLAELWFSFGLCLKLRGCGCCWKNRYSHCCSLKTAVVYGDGWENEKGFGMESWATGMHWFGLTCGEKEAIPISASQPQAAALEHRRRCCRGDAVEEMVSPLVVSLPCGCEPASLTSLTRCSLPSGLSQHVRADDTSIFLVTPSPCLKGQRKGWHCHRDFHTWSPTRVGRTWNMCLKKSQLFNCDTFIELWRKKKKIHDVFSPNLLLLSLFPDFYLLLWQKKRHWRHMYFTLFTCLIVLADAEIPWAVFHCHSALFHQCVQSSCRNFAVLGFVAPLFLCSGSAVCNSVRYAHRGHLHGSKYFEQESFGFCGFVICLWINTEKICCSVSLVVFL